MSGRVRTRGAGLAVAAALALSVLPARATPPDEGCQTYTVGGLSLRVCDHDICVQDPYGDWHCVPYERCITGDVCLPPPIIRDLTVQLDPTLCSLLKAVAPVVDGLPGPVHVDQESGDVYLGGGLLWDCPPYEP